MNEQEQQNQDEFPIPAELDVLKTRATQMGIQFHPAIGLEKLKAKIDAHLNDAPDVTDDEDTEPAPVEVVVETAGQLAKRLKMEASALIRCRITCMNPNKKEWESEIFTVGNASVGTIKRCVPFNADWHVEQFILNMIKNRQCQIFYTVTENGHKVRRGKLIKEFAVEILPPLSSKEIAALAQRQAMASGTTV